MWYANYLDLLPKIISQKASASRIAKRTGLPLEHARQLGRWARTGQEPTLPSPREPTVDEAPEPEDNAQDYLSDAPYIYNASDDTYITFLAGVPKPLVLPGETHREIIRAYSSYDDSPASINEVARTVGLPRPWIVKYLRAHGMTHDREPFTPEELATRSDADLVADALQLRRAAVYKKLEQAKWADIRADAHKWREYETHTLSALLRAAESRPPAPLPLPLPRGGNEHTEAPGALVVGLSDYHWGKYSDPAENGMGWDRAQARDDLLSALADLVARLPGLPAKIILPVGSDYFHTDTDSGTTSRGTPQDSDGTPAEVLISGLQMIEEVVLSLASVAPVELVLMSGNHDRLLGVAALMYLSAAFRADERVTVRQDRTPRVYLSYGRNLIGFAHGDGVSKTSDLAGHMAREAADLWSTCPHRTVYTGHYHNEVTVTHTPTGVVRRQLPSLSGPDRWHARHGYQGAPRSLPGYWHDEERGLVAVIYGLPG